jgi:hypothetical protein
MSIHLPELTPKQIASWIETSAAEVAQNAPREPLRRNRQRGASVGVAQQASFDFSGVREALNRAFAKTHVPALKPFRRLRRNQGAVNQSLIDSVGGTVAIVEAMADEIRALRAEVAELRAERSRSSSHGVTR